MNRNLWKGQVDQFRLWVRRNALTLFFTTVAVGMTLILAFDLPGARQVDVAVDRPAPNDIFAPRALTFTSDLLTDQARDQAVRAVADVYTPLDLGIGRAQLGLARGFFAFVETVRADSSANIDRRMGYLRTDRKSVV